MSEWIPVKERLPETNHKSDFGYFSEDVLVYCKEQYLERHTFIAYYYKTMENGEEVDGWHDAIDLENVHPIAWMPLPEPYREDGDTE